MFLISLLISLGAVLYAAYYFYTEFALSINDRNTVELLEKVHSVLNTQLNVLFKIIAIVSFVIILVFLSFNFFGWSVILGFLFGVFGLISTVYIFVIFLMRIIARLLNDKSNSLIKIFYQVFDGGNALGVYVIGSVLLLVSIYYLVFKPSAIGLVGMMFGTIVAGLFIKITSNIYATFFYHKTDIFSNFLFGKNKKNEIKDGLLPFQLAADNFKHGIGIIVESLENCIIAIIGSMIVASLVFPGFGGAIALPLMVVATGLVASVVGVKLIKIGSTNNIVINIFLVIFGTIVLASILIFPFILWLMTGNEQYSNSALWAVISTGFLSGGLLVYFNYIRIIKKFGHKDSLAIVSAFIALSVALSMLFAGLYGIALFVVGLVSLYAIFIKLNSFALVVGAAYKSTSVINTEIKRKQALEKLSLLSNIFTGSVKLFLYISTVFSALVFFFIYKREITSKLIQFGFQLDNPLIIAGLFLGGSMLYVIVGRLLVLKEKMYEIFQNNKTLSSYNSSDYKNDHAQSIKVFTLSIIKSIIPVLSLIFIFPILAAFIFGSEVLGGLFMGEIIIGTFWGLYIILKNETNKNLNFVNDGDNTGNATISSLIEVSIKVTMALALLLVVLL